VSAAARKLHVSQSAVSHQLRSLEEELGAKLYERVHRGIRLTAAGELLLGHARTVIQSVEDLQEEFADLRGQPRGTLRLAPFRGIAVFSLPDIVQRYHARYPRVRLVVSSKSFDREILHLTEAGEVDLGITASWNEFGALEYLEYVSYEMYACMSYEHPWVGRTEALTLADLAEQNLLLYEQGTAIRAHIDRVFARRDIRPEVTVEAAGSHALVEYARRGLGVGVISGLVMEGGRDPALHTIPVTDLFGRLGYGFVLRPRHHLPAAARALLEVAGVAPERLSR
jgi:DNA-binding transcriptional LysR family regulator